MVFLTLSLGWGVGRRGHEDWADISEKTLGDSKVFFPKIMMLIQTIQPWFLRQPYLENTELEAVFLFTASLIKALHCGVLFYSYFLYRI